MIEDQKTKAELPPAAKESSPPAKEKAK